MADAVFETPRLVAIYDALDGERSDLEVYARLVEKLGARRVLDVGCGTGTFALLLAARGCEVVGVDPAGASLDVARAKPGADRVTWLHGDATALPPLQVDAVTMTGNVAQAIVDPLTWDRTLTGVHQVLRPGGTFLFETRDPADRGWERWNRAESHAVANIPAVGTVESWVDVTAVDLPLVTFRWTFLFAADGASLTSDSTLRFRDREEVVAALTSHGFALEAVQDAPDRPGCELVFVARRAGSALRADRDADDLDLA